MYGNLKLVKNSFLDKDIVLLDSYDTARDKYINEQMESIKSSVIVALVKSDIYKVFIGESFAISTIASVLGVLFMGYCLYILSDINYISSNYEINIWIILLCLVIVYSLNIIVGLIPVFNTIKKSPAEILSRNDLE